MTVVTPRPSALALAGAALWLFSAPAVQAQAAASLGGQLTQGVRCSPDRALRDLRFRAATVKASQEEVAAALGVIADDALICDPIRAAARELAVPLVAAQATAPTTVTEKPQTDNPPTEETDIKDKARDVVERTLAEAGRRAAALKFDVGPPPPRLLPGHGRPW